MNLEDQKALDRLGATVSVQTDEVVQPQQKYPRLQKLVREVFAPALVVTTLLTSMGAAAYHQRSHDADAAIPPLSIPSPHVEVRSPKLDQSPSQVAAEQNLGFVKITVKQDDTLDKFAKRFSIEPDKVTDWKAKIVEHNGLLDENTIITGSILEMPFSSGFNSPD